MTVSRISVIVRTRGRTSLAETLASVAAQARNDVRLVVVDALGTLPPPDGQGLPMVWVSQGEPLHRSVAAQAGLEAADTRWALFLDDDDLLLPGHLDKLVSVLEQHPGAVLAHTGVELIGQGAHAQRRGVFDEAFDPWALLLGNRLPIHAALFDVDRARAGGARFDAALDVYEDWDFWLQLATLGDFVHVPGVSAQYRVGDDSSAAHRVSFGDEAYWRVWRKWWGRAPDAWWTSVFRASAESIGARGEIDPVRAALAERVAALDELHRQYAQLAADNQRLHADIAAHLAAFDSLRVELGRTQNTLRETEVQLAGAKHELARAEAGLRWHEDALQATREALTTTHSELAERRAQLAQTGLSLANARFEQQRSAEQLHAMLHSSSWRLTQPLRQAAQKLRDARARLGRFERNVLSRQALIRGRGYHAYQRWIQEVEAPARAERAKQRRVSGTRFSLLMPVFDPALPALNAAVASVLAQTHGDWELCIADDASTLPEVRPLLVDLAARDARIRVEHRELNGGIAACTNTALSMARGDWLVLLDQDDVLSDDALAEIAAAIDAVPDAGLVYSDEDKLDAGARRFEPHFKPGFSIELLRGQNMIGHLAAYRRSLVLELEGVREGFEGAQDHDLALRAVERLRPEQVLHVPRVLYHWRVGPHSTAGALAHKAHAAQAALRAVNDHLSRVEPTARAEFIPGLPWLRVRHSPPSQSDATQWHLVLRPGLRAESPVAIDEMAALLMRPGIGVVGGTVFASGRLVAGCWVADHEGQWQVLCAHARAGEPGPFGAARLVRGCDAVSSQAMMIRRELLPLWNRLAQAPDADIAFGAAVRQAGWRIVWTPHAVFDEVGRWSGFSSSPVPRG